MVRRLWQGAACAALVACGCAHVGELPLRGLELGDRLVELRRRSP
jgi:hypothetical protein